MEKRKYNRIKAVLADKDVDQKALSAYLGTGETSVSRWCNNKAQPSIDVFFKIAEFLHVSVCDLLVEEKK
ncbi:XRE family transcriptional regulator [Chryseobacterium carnipullorum]|uniref:Predicted transcriptional regulator n=1 Tax=Chryseobacterium carnipullorum TaxID=1124835 RepID=A0A376DVI1_CHRCU|nr:helix-turn-helix transcriptional regulator [Chryseobacterium carnipullorum]AZA49771.1 XRE family transcriptional regulator [Chryseobacterium carnipullorum]AZA64663.1 XRE family transcriptional regulator [Chryseobacterium carnipullorum]STC95666.1 Predicted transcriptional regulator [Chryseobacterium carnipullorum]